MKRQHLSLIAMAVLLAAGGFWLTRSSSRTHPVSKSSANSSFESPHGQPESGQALNPPLRRLAPPDPTRRFRDFTPEQRVEFARKGHGPGG